MVWFQIDPEPTKSGSKVKVPKSSFLSRSLLFRRYSLSSLGRNSQSGSLLMKNANFFLLYDEKFHHMMKYFINKKVFDP